MKVFHYCFIVLLFMVNLSFGETVYFLVAEKTPYHGDSYVVSISDFEDINYARALIKYGPSIGETIVCADISCQADGINRDHYAPDKRAWNWHVTQFKGFADITVEILDGTPGLVEDNCSGWSDGIGFWNYTIVEELGTDPDIFQCNFDHELPVNLADFALFANQWLNSDCSYPDWCQGADADRNGTVELADLQYCMGFWLIDFWALEPPLWFDAWDCPTQCYGNADCDSHFMFPNKLYPVYNEDMSIYLNVWNGANWPAHYGDLNYDPRADFDRDYDVDDDDGVILQTWYGVDESEVPTDCPTAPQ